MNLKYKLYCYIFQTTSGIHFLRKKITHVWFEVRTCNSNVLDICCYNSLWRHMLAVIKRWGWPAEVHCKCGILFLIINNCNDRFLFGYKLCPLVIKLVQDWKLAHNFNHKQNNCFKNSCFKNSVSSDGKHFNWLLIISCKILC